MLSVLMHDPSYSSGVCSAPEIGVYGGWAALPGSFSEAQSRSEEPGKPVLLFSGECFPAQAGSSKQTSLLLSYAADGERFIHTLNGLFSGLLIDRRRRIALLFNDRFGSERIYFSESDGNLFFASEAKALLAVLPQTRAFDDEGVAQFLAYGSTRDNRTLFRGVSLMPAGSVWRLGEEPARRRYFLPAEWEAQEPASTEEFETELVDALRAVMPSYLEPASKVGISITGGLDTRMIMACLNAGEGGQVCYTYVGATGETLDARIGREVAEAVGLEHHNLRVTPDFLARFDHFVDETVRVTDGCCGVLGAHEILFSDQARKLASIRLTGNFGSEILRSVTTYKPRRLAPGLLSPDFAGHVSAAARASTADHPVTAAAFKEIPWHLFGTVSAARSRLTFRSPFMDNTIVKLAYRAPIASRTSAHAALRFVSANEAVASIPTDRGVIAGAKGAGALAHRLFADFTFKLDYLDKEGLPDWLAPAAPVLRMLAKLGLLGLHKFLPYRAWFQRELAPFLNEALLSSHTRALPYFDPRFFSSVVRDTTAGRKNYLNEINAVLTLEAVERVLIRASSD